MKHPRQCTTASPVPDRRHPFWGQVIRPLRLTSLSLGNQRKKFSSCAILNTANLNYLKHPVTAWIPVIVFPLSAQHLTLPNNHLSHSARSGEFSSQGPCARITDDPGKAGAGGLGLPPLTRVECIPGKGWGSLNEGFRQDYHRICAGDLGRPQEAGFSSGLDVVGKWGLFMFVCLSGVCVVPVEARRGLGIPWSWSWGIVNYLIWVLRTKLQSSRRAASCLNHQANSPAKSKLIKMQAMGPMRSHNWMWELQKI